MSARLRAHYHPYKPSTPKASPAGIRIVNFLNPKRCFNLFQTPNLTDGRSPDPSPLNSPVREPTFDEDDPGTLRRIHQLFTKDDPTKRPTTPTPDHPRNATPSTQAKDAPKRPHRPTNAKRGPKHLSFSSGAIRPGILSSRTRMSERHAHRLARARKSIHKLCREASALTAAHPAQMDDEDRIFFEQLTKIEGRRAMDEDLAACRAQMARAAVETSQRRRAHAKRDREAAARWGPEHDEQAREEQAEKVAAFVAAEKARAAAHFQAMEEAAMRVDAERQRVHDAAERAVREAQERAFHEAQTREAKAAEEARKKQAERERMMARAKSCIRRLRAGRERMEQENAARLERERQAREEAEHEAREARRAREEVERKAREARRVREEVERKAREERQAQHDAQVRTHYATYEGKWVELRASRTLPPIQAWEMPWPVLGVVTSAEQITYEGVRTFLFHPLRPGVEGKTAREKVKPELLRFHPDKFTMQVLPKIRSDQQAVAEAIASAVVRMLTRIMNEVTMQEN